MFKDIFLELLSKENITAYKLSKDLNVSEALISQWKSGRQLPKYDSLNLLCDYFNVSADYLLGRTNNPHSHLSPLEIIDITKNNKTDTVKFAAYSGNEIKADVPKDIDPQAIIEATNKK